MKHCPRDRWYKNKPHGGLIKTVCGTSVLESSIAEKRSKIECGNCMSLIGMTVHKPSELETMILKQE